jgi:hypothetical protein
MPQVEAKIKKKKAEEAAVDALTKMKNKKVNFQEESSENED